MSARRQKVLLAGVVGLVALTCAAIVIAAQGRQRPGSSRPADGPRWSKLPPSLTREPAPTLRLRDQNDRWVDTRALRGRPYLVTFLYTRCPDVCPLIGQEIARSLDQLGAQASKLPVLGVSVDPTGDTKASTMEWVRRLKLPPSFRYLRGDERALEPIWNRYFVAPQIAGRPETSTHTATITFVDRRGRRIGQYPAGDPVSINDLAHDMRYLLSR